MSETVRVAAIQLCSGVEADANLDVIDAQVAAAAGAGAVYVQTPEVSVAFARDKAEMAKVALPFKDNPAVNKLSEMARQHGIYLHLGSMAVTLADGHFANRSILFAPDGKIAARYDKIHLFDADPPGDRPYRESDAYRGGSEAVVANAGGFVLGFSVCYDLRFAALYAALAEAGAEVLAVPAAFTASTGRAHWEILVRARAIETGAFVIAAAQAGRHENGRQTWGHSMIVDPWGQILAEKGDDQPGLIIADLDLTRVADARQRVPVLANRRPFSLSVNKNPQ